MQRRRFIQNAALFSAGLAASAGAKADEKIGKPSATSPMLIQSPDAIKALPGLVELSSACSASGSLCVQHCQDQMASGATEFTKCLTASSQMLVICQSISRLASMKSILLKQTLDACSSACVTCKEACDEHKAHWKLGMHLECKACAEHCEQVISAVAKIKAMLVKEA